MSTHLSKSRQGLVAAAVLICGLTGCRKAGPAVERALVQKGERAAFQKGEKAVERSLRQGGRAANREENGFVKWAKEEGPDLAGDVAQKQFEDWQKRQNTAPGPRVGEGNGQRFPFPLSTVKPLPGYEPDVDPQTGNYALPNNYGGVIVYDPAGNPLGFSARNRKTGEQNWFDRLGNRR